MKKILMDLICFLLIGWIVFEGIKIINEVTIEDEGNETIELVSTICMNEQEKLIVISFQNTIEDKGEFAKEILDKYINNTFQAIRLSDDINTDVQFLEVLVYLGKENMQNEEIEMLIEYKPKNNIQKYNIKDNPEQFDIYIDGMKYKNIRD